ncbi:MAG TPA: hypothetical protein DCS97_13725 [Planctomycetes bacterium]|nr:hypothetical protein [Planctomycetota bacterium]
MDPHAAIVAHVRWKVRLLTAVETGKAPDRATSCVDDRCPLGVWIHGDESAALHGDPLFQQLRHKHADFHTSLGPIIDAIAENRPTVAKQAIADPQGAFRSNTEAVVECLVRLKQSREGGAA